MIPEPTRVRLWNGVEVMTYAVVPTPKCSSETVTDADSPTLIAFEKSNVATSLAPFGTVTGVQFDGTFQSPVAFTFHVALAAKAASGLRTKQRLIAAARSIDDGFIGKTFG
jgi:hypothetical protein